VVLTLGRDASNDIILEDKLISRNHAMIRRLGRDGYYLIDMGSSNGTYVNKKRVTSPVLLRDGDSICLGEATMVFRQETHVSQERDLLDEQEKTALLDNSEVQKIAILVADIRDYMELTETAPIHVLTSMMSHWFREVNRCVEQHDGVVDKFIGDCVYARWSTDGDMKNIVRQTLNAALALSRLTAELGMHQKEISRPIRIGVGINTGEAGLGVGVDATALGDAVNLAFRLEEASKQLGMDVVMSASAYQHLAKEVWAGRERQVSVRGKQAPIRVCAWKFGELDQLLQKSGTGLAS
jgi:adenylate cyclase